MHDLIKEAVLKIQAEHSPNPSVAKSSLTTGVPVEVCLPLLPVIENAVNHGGNCDYNDANEWNLGVTYGAVRDFLAAVEAARQQDEPRSDIIGWPDSWPKRFNACTEPCDMLSGPCACGAWHHAEAYMLRDVLRLMGEQENLTGIDKAGTCGDAGNAEHTTSPLAPGGVTVPANTRDVYVEVCEALTPVMRLSVKFNSHRGDDFVWWHGEDDSTLTIGKLKAFLAALDAVKRDEPTYTYSQYQKKFGRSGAKQDETPEEAGRRMGKEIMAILEAAPYDFDVLAQTIETAEVKPDGQTIGERSGESCSRCGRANTWHPDCPTCERIMRLEQKLAAQAAERTERAGPVVTVTRPVTDHAMIAKIFGSEVVGKVQAVPFGIPPAIPSSPPTPATPEEWQTACHEWQEKFQAKCGDVAEVLRRMNDAEKARDEAVAERDELRGYRSRAANAESILRHQCEVFGAANHGELPDNVRDVFRERDEALAEVEKLSNFLDSAIRAAIENGWTIQADGALTPPEGHVSAAWCGMWRAHTFEGREIQYPHFLVRAMVDGKAAEAKAEVERLTKQLPVNGDVIPTEDTPPGYTGVVRLNNDVSWVTIKAPKGSKQTGFICELACIPESLLEHWSRRQVAEAEVAEKGQALRFTKDLPTVAGIYLHRNYGATMLTTVRIENGHPKWLSGGVWLKAGSSTCGEWCGPLTEAGNAPSTIDDGRPAVADTIGRIAQLEKQLAAVTAEREATRPIVAKAAELRDECDRLAKELAEYEQQSVELREQVATALTERDELRRVCAAIGEAESDVESIRQYLLTAAGDDLCRLSQEDIEAMKSGAVPIPPKEEFLASCARFHAQIAGEYGINENCLTLAQLVDENEKLRAKHASSCEAYATLAEQCDNLRAKLADSNAARKFLQSENLKLIGLLAGGNADKPPANLAADISTVCSVIDDIENSYRQCQKNKTAWTYGYWHGETKEVIAAWPRIVAALSAKQQSVTLDRDDIVQALLNCERTLPPALSKEETAVELAEAVLQCCGNVNAMPVEKESEAAT